jgi:hypothetical protein
MQNQEVETLKNNTPEYIKLSHLWRQSHSGVAGLIISNAQSIVKRIYKVSRLSQRLASDDSRRLQPKKLQYFRVNIALQMPLAAQVGCQ